MSIPEDLLYARDHIWARIEGNKARVGLTQYAQSNIGEILLAELADTGKEVKKGEKIAVIETAKAIFDVKTPLSGTVTEANEELEEDPDRITKDPYGAGWLIVLQIAPSEETGYLMDWRQYEAFLMEEGALEG